MSVNTNVENRSTSDESSNRMEFFRTPGGHGISSLTICYAGREACSSNHHFGPASRAQYLLHFITRGKGRFCVNHNTYFLGANQVFLIQPNITTYYIADSKDPWEYIWIGFDGQDACSILKNCGLLGKDPFTDFAPSEELMACLNRIVEGMKTHDANDYELLGSFFSVFGLLSGSRCESDESRENAYLRKAIEYIRKNYGKDINVQNIADFIGINRTYLYRLFMQEFSVSPKQYILNYRLHAAADLLFRTDMTVSAVALSCGFSDISSFCSHFKKASGFTPGQYRSVDGKKQLTWKMPE